MDSPLCSEEKMPEYGMETSDVASQKFRTQTLTRKVIFTLSSSSVHSNKQCTL
jgi:hypothetical protein